VKLHRNLVLAIISALDSTFQQKQVTSRALETLWSQNPKWGKRDRAFVAETTYEIVRWRRLLEWGAQSDDFWALLAAQLVRSGHELPDWDEFSGFDANEIHARLETRDLPRAIRHSIPDWLDELGEKQLGTRWNAEISALNEAAPSFCAPTRSKSRATSCNFSYKAKPSKPRPSKDCPMPCNCNHGGL
jgi:16S rRNA (cytosine967-C5)-methyltransferase